VGVLDNLCRRMTRATHNTARRSWWPVLVGIPSLGDEDDNCRCGRCQVEVTACSLHPWEAGAGVDQWGWREEGAGGRGGPTLELDLYDLFLAGASAGSCSTYVPWRGLGGRRARRTWRAPGGRWPRAPAQPAVRHGVSECLSPLSLVAGRWSRAQTRRSFFITHAGWGVRRCWS
jgi:hypothetical protein